ncbi:MAG: hypothetical protein LBD10_14190 [Desulfobulbus sp.]|jgi:hypothetical protein|uniref:hypothetical protein n=1 Tax=Desulfobulbus sp. TaxID=895 RepID=UPI00284F69C4|nr:hypothetical protein [Desulfobulbus sp.]MDR2551340.1 hypothetical protein [Desulfobulbus sp.]
MNDRQPYGHRLPGPILSGLLTGLLLALPAQAVKADDEIRVGAVVQIPFNLSSERSLFDPGAIRLGMTCQYANVEEDKITTTRGITNTYVNGTLTESVETPAATQVDEGNRVYGVEGNVFVTVLGDWNISGEVLGLYGTNHVQGALGAGYGLAESFFLDAKGRFPYSEVGLRFLNGTELYGGLNTLGDFNSGKQQRRYLVKTNRNNYSPTEDTVVVIE